MTVNWHGPEFEAHVRANVQKAVMASALILQNNVDEHWSVPGTGVKYKRLPNVSAGPGLPPAIQRGTLRNSIQIDDRKLLKKNPLVKVGTALKYGFWQEFGTTKMGEHPWLRPAYVRSIPRIFARFTFDRLTEGWGR